MARRYCLPFKTVLGSEVVLGAWHYRVGGGDWLRADSGVAGWDYLARLAFRREISVDTQKARKACELELGARLDLVVTAHCPTARFRAVVFRTPLTQHSWSGLAEFVVQSPQVAEQLRLDTEIILGRTRAGRGDSPQTTAAVVCSPT